MPSIAIEAATRTLPYTKTADVNRSSTEEPQATIPKTEDVTGRQTTNAEASNAQAAAQVAAAKKTTAEEAIARKETARDATEEPPSDEATREAVEKLQTYTDRLDRNLEFSVDDSSGRTVVTVRDGGTEEVIRQIPSEEALRLASDIDRGDSVSFVDSRA